MRMPNVKFNPYAMSIVALRSLNLRIGTQTDTTSHTCVHFIHSTQEIKANSTSISLIKCYCPGAEWGHAIA
jgi:hypothetical protein